MSLEMLFSSGKQGKPSENILSFGVSPDSFDAMIKAMLDADVSNSTNITLHNSQFLNVIGVWSEKFWGRNKPIGQLCWQVHHITDTNGLYDYQLNWFYVLIN